MAASHKKRTVKAEAEVGNSRRIQADVQRMGTVAPVQVDIANIGATEALGVARRLAETAGRHREMVPLLNEFLVEIRKLTDCIAVGVCLQDDAGGIRYQADSGFCGDLRKSMGATAGAAGGHHPAHIERSKDEPKLLHTDGGSVYTNNAAALASTEDAWELLKTPSGFEDLGCESIAHIPIVAGERKHGFVRLGDPRTGVISLPLIRILEIAALELGSAIERIDAEESLRRDRDEQHRRGSERAVDLMPETTGADVERDKLRGILDAMETGVHIVDQDSNILFANHAVLRDFGPINGRKCHDYFGGFQEPCPWCEREEVLAGASTHREWYSAKTGKTYDLLCAPIQNADGTHAKLEIVHDITRHRKSADELRRNHDRLRSVSARLLQVQEAERARVSRKLHDELAQALGILKLRLGFVRKQLGEEQAPARKECNETIEYLNQVIEDTRRLSNELGPSILEDLGLGAALRRLVTQFGKSCHCNVVSRIENLNPRLSRDVEINVYRIIQEALKNIEQHAGARNVSVILERVDRQVMCLVEDDGCGFDREEIESRSTNTTMGLVIINERVRILGSSLDLVSRKGEGTRICFNVPIQEVVAS